MVVTLASMFRRFRAGLPGSAAARMVATATCLEPWTIHTYGRVELHTEQTHDGGCRCMMDCTGLDWTGLPTTMWVKLSTMYLVM